MNNKATYELIITEKLQSLPLPDMADAIWDRIEHQLDLDMPEGDGGGGDSNPFGGAPSRWIGYGFGLFMIAFLAIYFNKKPRTNNLVQPVETHNVNQINTENKNTTAPYTANPPPAPPLRDLINPGQQVDSSATITNPLITGPVAAGIVDTFSAQPMITTASIPKSDTSKPVGKKPKGVTGLTDDDYKIVPKRDSN